MKNEVYELMCNSMHIHRTNKLQVSTQSFMSLVTFRKMLFVVASLLVAQLTFAQTQIITLTANINNSIISNDRYRVFVTKSDTLNSTPSSIELLPQALNNLNVEDTEATYWILITLNKTDSQPWFIEFLDAHIKPASYRRMLIM